MKIALTGASGFLGKRLIDRLLASGHELHLLGRTRPRTMQPGTYFYAWDALSGDAPVDALEGAEAIIHMAGEPVAQRWTVEVKNRIIESRMKGTQSLVAGLARLKAKPAVLIAASAIGYYGSRGDELLTETSTPGRGFLPGICVQWERAVDQAAGLVFRIVKLRIGIVLGTGGGALETMLPPFKLGVGGKLGDGQMWMSWIHIDDIVGLIEFALNNNAVAGPMNGTAPMPVRNEQFTKALGAVLHRPTVFPIPAMAIKLLYGEMSEVVLGSTRVAPSVALQAGYRFHHVDIEPALRDVLKDQ